MSDATEIAKLRVAELIALGVEVRASVTWRSEEDVTGRRGYSLLLADPDLFAKWRSQSRRFLAGHFGPSSTVAGEFESAVTEGTQNGIQAGLGVLAGIQEDLDEGYMESAIELAHAETFGDYLDMADHLIDEKREYKDAAMVIAGSTLEAHIKKLCVKNNLPIVDAKTSGDVPKKSQRLCDDLSGAKAIDTNDQKAVTSWLALRNDAAHGDYHKYEAPQVRGVIMLIRDFIRRYPA